MSDGVAYVVRVQYRVDDGTSGPIDKIAEKAKKASKESGNLSGIWSGMGSVLSGIGNAATGVFDSIVSGAAAGAIAIGAMAVAGAGKMISEGIKVNAAIEDSTIAFANQFSLAGVTTGFNEGLGAAKSLVDGIRADAAALPGEFQDFLDMSNNIMSSMLNMGKSVGDVRRNVSLLAATSASLGMKGKAGFQQAANEYAELLSGRAGTQNKLGVRLGVNAHTKVDGVEFNQASAEKRYAFIQKLMEKSKDALPAFEKSWSGVTSSLTDNFKGFLGRVTAPLMGRMISSMDKFSKFFSPRSNSLADSMGDTLVKVYDYLEGKVITIARHWGEIKGAALAMQSAASKAYEFAKPALERGAKFAKGAAADPVTAIGELIALRLGAGAAMSGAGAAFSAGGAVAGAAVAVPAVAVGTALIDDVGGSVAHVGQMLSDWGKTFVDIFHVLFDKGSLFRDILGGIGAVVIWLVDIALLPLKILFDATVWVLKQLNEAWKWLKEQAGEVGGVLNTVGSAFSSVYEGATEMVNKLRNLFKSNGTGDADFLDADQIARDFVAGVVATRTAAEIGESIFNTLRGLGKGGDNLDALSKASKNAGGKGGTTVNVNAPLTVLSDSDPDRLAKSVAVHIKNTLQSPVRGIAVRTYLDG